MRWQLELKTGSKRGVLLYNTGLSSRSDFVGVELEGGRVRLLVDKGDGPAELRSDTPVSDGRWHRVAVHFNPTYMEISVDGQVASMRLALGDNRYLDLAETVYVGGIELNKRARALNQGLRSAEESFKGCVRNMEVDGKKIGIPEARITLGILPDCVWEFPCARDEPCVAGARCFQHGVDSFRCECEQPLCVKSEFAAGYKVFTKTSLPVDLEIVALNSLNVAEGDNAVITPHNIDVVLDYPKFGVRDSGVIFRVVAAPRHGRVQAEQAWSRGNEATVFTLLDLGKDKVRYVHDGSESHADAIEMELELNPGTGFTLPGYLQGRHRFLLPVNVSAVNDPPELIIPTGKVLRLAQGTKKTIGPDLLTAQDPDTPSTELVYAVLSVNAGGKDGRSHLESSRNPGQALDTFTQKDIDEGTVAFVHHGEAGSGRVALRVSDGIETGAAAMMRVVAFPLQLRLVNNTGLVMTHNASSLIIPRNLAFVTNADEPEYLEINYAITKAPQFGTLQRLRNTEASGEARWQTVQHFTSFQLAREQIRYVHTTGSPTHDEFKVSAVETKSPTVYDFRIIFVELRLDSVHNEELTLDGVQDGTIRATHLHYDTVPQASAGEEVVYHIIRSTRYGSLILGDGTASSATETRLKSGDTFTQQDVAGGRLRYALTRRAYSRIHDDFSFRVSTKAVNNGEPSQDVSTFSLIHIPGPTSDPVRATLERLEVVEGGQQTITQSHLHLETSRVAAVSYNITRSPRHGRIDVLKAGTTGVARSNTSWFDSREIESKKVVYIHDDSESRKDSFHFLAYAPDFQYLGVFHFDIVLKNDNKPVRTVDRVFRVVRGGERLITGADLRFEDADLDTRPEDIVYTRRGIPNYGIYRASDTEPLVPLFEFTQADLDAGRVLFKHGGTEEYGKVSHQLYLFDP
ncbi:hypothetical protein B566_EDAN002340 [Ephemera danica]|nr:hypothetical protein B566_EDAN002340 [Ephemera danica]